MLERCWRIPLVKRFTSAVLVLAAAFPLSAAAAGTSGGFEQPGLAEAASGFWSSHIDGKAWIEAVQSARTKKPYSEVTSRLHGRAELKGNFDLFNAFVSADIEKNWTIPAMDGLSLREAWVEHVGDGWDLRAGRQLIIWGKADGVRITDNICPTDYADNLNRDLDEMRIPVPAARLRFMHDTWTSEFIWIPEFRPQRLASGRNPWAVDRFAGYSLPVAMGKTEGPSGDYSFKDSELALKLSSYMAGFDMSASVFYTWDDNASYYYDIAMTPQGPTMRIRPRNHRIMIYGLDFAYPFGDFVLRGEAALFSGRRLAMKSGQPERGNVAKYLLGLDWSPGGHWTVVAQLLDDWVLGHSPRMSPREHSPQATLNVSRTFFNEMLTVSDMIYCSLYDGEFFNRLQLKYEVAQGVDVTVGWDKFAGNDGAYGIYRRNSQVWAKLRWSF